MSTSVGFEDGATIIPVQKGTVKLAQVEAGRLAAKDVASQIEGERVLGWIAKHWKLLAAVVGGALFISLIRD